MTAPSLTSAIRDGLLVSMGLDSLYWHRGLWTARFRTKLQVRYASATDVEAVFARVVQLATDDARACYERDCVDAEGSVYSAERDARPSDGPETERAER